MIKFIIQFIVLAIAALLLQGCETSTSVGQSFDETYQNNIPARGVMVGGATGAVAGGITSGMSGIIPGAAGGMVIGGAVGAFIDEHSTTIEKIENRGGKVMVLGDQIMIVLPSHFLFHNMTADLAPTAYSTLNLVADMINSKQNVSMSVKVTAHANPTSSEKLNLILTQQQANSVVKYLWQRGVDTRLISAEGMGSSHLVTKAMPYCETNANYRVEIVFEKLPT